ncbi:hypothetical protein [Kamptonema formosum]|uniref:hypothetical protein n=1 Tax=Kamptonema formosum TaxID=331992 RepID=UPI0012DE0B22|nr:hypothetical protein [Oscillatoria sp. PCC 10802]
MISQAAVWGNRQLSEPAYLGLQSGRRQPVADVNWMQQACGAGCGHVTGVAEIASDVRRAVPPARGIAAERAGKC